MQTAETWVVRTDVQNPWGVARHRVGSRCWRARGAIRELSSEEMNHYRPCGNCILPEHDGPFDSAEAAAAAIREAAVAAGHAAITLKDLGYFRIAKTLRLASRNLFESAERAEPQEVVGS